MKSIVYNNNSQKWDIKMANMQEDKIVMVGYVADAATQLHFADMAE